MSTARLTHVRVGERPYPVYVGAGLAARIPDLLSKQTEERRVAVLVDDAVADAFAARLLTAFRSAGWRIDSRRLPGGERAKTFSSLLELYGWMIERKLERRTPIVAVGGGAVGDAAGFAAATYFRGLPLVHVPTTLLAMVDSSIGGKTAVNHPAAKNAVGTFHQPLMVAADIDALSTLDREEFRAGMAEVVKYALLYDRTFADWLASHWNAAVEDRDPAALVKMIHRCAALKAAAVSGDERDLTGKRELLNFGHTVGHALETATHFRHFRHGEAVTWGMRAALELSKNRMRLPRADQALAEALFLHLPSVPWPRGLSREAVVDALAKDKKIAASRNVFVLLKAIGKPFRANDITRSEILSVLSRIQ